MTELQKTIKVYLVERGWNNLRPSDLAKSISIESAELLEIFQWSNASLDETKRDAAKLKQIRSELADVLLYCLDMATLLNVDADQIILEKLKKISKKYPPHLMKSTNGKEPGTDDAYLNIKKNYRKKGLS